MGVKKKAQPKLCKNVDWKIKKATGCRNLRKIGNTDECSGQLMDDEDYGESCLSGITMRYDSRGDLRYVQI